MRVAAMPGDVGPFSGFVHEMRTPAHLFTVWDLVVPELGFVHIISRDSHQVELLERMVREFDRLRRKRYEPNILHVYQTNGVEPFDCIGIAPPRLARVYEGRSATLTAKAFQVFPMYGIEFLQGYSAEQFWTQRRRSDKWRVCVLDWNRRLQYSAGVEQNAGAETPGLL